MKEKLQERLTDRGQVGIGTLIVFIAMVLVAAIAAGVLINTAGFLQTKSEQTGQESSDQVSNRVVVVSKVGNVDSTGPGINQLTLTVMKSSGSGDIDLSASTISWNGPDNTNTLTYEGLESDGSSPTSDTFTVGDVRDDDNDAPVLTAQEDRYEIHIDAEAVEGSLLDEGASAQIRITSRSGATTLVRIKVPDSLAGDNTVTV
ncbi:flagellin [Halobacteriales archaeon QS_1_67_19]|nr:MAG: flagellin [Halobacteriales archaeon QS_1_67_19]